MFLRDYEIKCMSTLKVDTFSIFKRLFAALAYTFELALITGVIYAYSMRETIPVEGSGAPTRSELPPMLQEETGATQASQVERDSPVVRPGSVRSFPTIRRLNSWDHS
jgi:hypothetical protein